MVRPVTPFDSSTCLMPAPFSRRVACSFLQFTPIKKIEHSVFRNVATHWAAASPNSRASFPNMHATSRADKELCEPVIEEMEQAVFRACGMHMIKGARA